MLISACLRLLVVNLAAGTSTCDIPGKCDGNETTGLLQLQKRQARLVGLSMVQGCCVVVDASNMSNVTLARTEMGTTDDCYSNAAGEENPAGYIHYFTLACPDSVIEGILEGFKLDVGGEVEAVPGQPTPEAPSLALAMAGSSSARTAALNYVVFESFEGRAWPEPDGLKIAYLSPNPSGRGTLRNLGADGTARSLGPLLNGAIWRSPEFPITSSVGTTLQAWIRTPASSPNSVSDIVNLGFDTDPALSGSKTLRLYQVCHASGSCRLQMDFYDRRNWGYRGVAGRSIYSIANSWHRLLIQVLSTHWVVARVYDASGNLRGTLGADFSRVDGVISPSGTAFVSIEYRNNNVLVDELATCAATVNKELSTDVNLCSSSQAPFVDTCIPGVTYRCSPSAPLTVGIHQIQCRYSDGYDVSFETEVKDTELPVLTKNFEDVIEVTTCGEIAQVVFEVQATDNCDSLTPTCIPPSGSLFPVGTTTVTCTAEDSAGNSATPMAFQVTVAGDTTPPGSPVVSPVNPTGDAGSCGDSAQVIFDATFTDECQPVNVLCIPTSGSSFQLGSTPVECTAADPSGNTAKANFEVTVTGGDTTPPVFDPALVDKTADAGCVDFAQVSFEANATDGCGPPHVTCTPPSLSLFPVGSTTVQCTATDVSGNTATENFEIIVVKGVEPPSFGPTSDVEVHTQYCRTPRRVQFEVPVIGGCGEKAECFPASGSLFRVGTTRVTCTASNDAGSAQTSFNVHLSCDPPGYRHHWQNYAR